MSIAAIEATVLRDVLRGLGHPQGGLRPALQVGEMLSARIGMDVLGAKTLMLGGVRIPATLPENVMPGQALQLRVIESTHQRLVMQIVRDGAEVAGSGSAGTAASAAAQQNANAQQAAGAASTALPYHAVPMPGGGTAYVWSDPEQAAGIRGAADERTRTMVVRYQSPDLGRMDVVLRLDPDQLETTIFASSGEPLESVRSAVPKLRAALAEATERPVLLMTGGRREDVDVRA